MADPAKPTVPVAPGVPPVQRTGTSTPAPVTPATSDGPGITVTAPTVVWGIHDTDGDDVFNVDQGPTSFAEVDDSKQENIPDYPVESGGFQSFNKVERPGEVQLTLTKEGSDAARQTFRQRIDSLRSSVQLLNILTPSRTFKNYNLTEVSVSRNATRGAALLTMHLTFKEVRNDVTATFSNVASSSAAANTNSGAVQAAKPSATQTPGSSPR